MLDRRWKYIILISMSRISARSSESFGMEPDEISLIVVWFSSVLGTGYWIIFSPLKTFRASRYRNVKAIKSKSSLLQTHIGLNHKIKYYHPPTVRKIAQGSDFFFFFLLQLRFTAWITSLSKWSHWRQNRYAKPYLLLEKKTQTDVK